MNSSFRLNDVVKIVNSGEGYSMATEIAIRFNARYWKHGRYINFSDTRHLYRITTMEDFDLHGNRTKVYIERLDGEPKGFLIGVKGLELVEHCDFLTEEDFNI